MRRGRAEVQASLTNNFGSYGRWDFVEFSDVFAIEEDSRN
jgi:hypothetical protein